MIVVFLVSNEMFTQLLLDNSLCTNYSLEVFFPLVKAGPGKLELLKKECQQTAESMTSDSRDAQSKQQSWSSSAVQLYGSCN